MADKSLQVRSMRKAVARVDVGVFGIPMRYAAWMRSKRSSWSGLIAVSAGQAVAGLLVALLLGLAFGVPANAFSLTLLVCFAIGSAIGGPVSFLLWSVLLLGVTGLIGGLIGGAWVASPAWWRALAAHWAEGKSVPSWFLVAVPAWILLWIGGSYGIAKLVDRIYEALSLSISFKAATRFSSEDQRIRDEAFAESNVTPVESRSLIDNGADGTEAIIAGTPQVVEPGVRLSKDTELGGDPDTPAPSYDNLLEEDMDDPDVLRAMGMQSSPATPVSPDAPGVKSTAFVIERDEPVSTAEGVTLPPELSEPDLPAVPSDNAAPLRRVTPPKIDALASRAMSKKLQQLLTSFEIALFEDKDEDFIRTNQDELALISEEQKAMLRAMDNSGPLLSAIAAVQRERAGDFLMGRSSPPLAEGTGAITPADTPSEIEETPATSAVVSDDIEAVEDAPAEQSAPDDAADQSGADTGEVVVADSVAAMGNIFSNIARRGRTPVAIAPVEQDDVDAPEAEESDVVVADVGDLPSTTSEVETPAPAVAVTVEAASEAVVAEPQVVAPVAEATVPQLQPIQPRSISRAAEIVGGFVIPRPPGEVRAPAIPVAAEPVPEPVSAPGETVTDGAEHQPEHGEISSVGTDGEVVVFEFDIEEPVARDAEPAQSVEAEVPEETEAPAPAATQDADSVLEEDEMGSLVFSRLVCLQVNGLVTGSALASVKANDVLEFEREKDGISVAQVINSRSFDEHIGASEAVAARHLWKDIQLVLSQSGVERLVSDFERLNARGQAMVEEPHTLTPAAFFAFETDRTRMLTAASANDDTLAATLILMDRSREILEALTAIRARREAARTQGPVETAATVVRQKVPAGEDVEATRGRSMLQSVLGGARRGRDLLRSGEVAPAGAAASGGSGEEEIKDVEAHDDVAPVVEPMSSVLEETPVSTRVPAYGDEDYESGHAPGTADYDFDMEMHGHALTARRRIAAQAQEKAEREERERQEKADLEEKQRQEKADQEERDRQEKADREERERQEKADAERETERLRLLQGDEAFIKAERERTEAAARETAARAAEAEAAAAAAAAAAEREARENARSEEDQRILSEHRARLDGHTLPVRFRERDIPTRFLKLTELRDQRKKFQTMVAMAEKIPGLEGVPEAVASPATRSVMMMDVLIGTEAGFVYESILAILDPEQPGDVDFVRNMVPEGEDRRFVVSIQAAISLGKTSDTALRDADAKLVQMRQAVSSLEGVAGLGADLERVSGELTAAQERETALRLDLERAASGSQGVEAERDQLKRELEALNRKMSGIVDDDFQHLLEKYARPVEDAPFAGVFLMMSPNRSHIVMVVTATPDALPGGVVRVGDRSLMLSEVIQIMFDNVKRFATDSMDAYFTNSSLTELAKGGTFTTTYADRSITSFKQMVNGLDMTIDPEDLQKGE